MVAQNYISIGLLYHVMWEVAFLASCLSGDGSEKCHPHSIQSKHGAITQLYFNVVPASKTVG